MGSNHLRGAIPGELSFLSSVKTLSLHNNLLVGSIPSTFANGSSLQVLDLRHNFLQGGLQETLFSSRAGSQNLTSLRVLLLDYNRSIPPHLHLPAFIASSTSLHQPPTTLATQGTLFEDDIIIDAKGIDIKYSYILNVLTSIDFSGSALSGAIPRTLGQLTGLVYLNLSRKNLTGPIPVEVSKLYALESLDLSVNNLTGSIPKDLSALARFNVSFNVELYGAIPAGAQLDEADSYLGDSKLFGLPLRLCSSSAIHQGRAPKPRHHKFVEWIQGWAFARGILFGLIVGFVCTMCAMAYIMQSNICSMYCTGLIITHPAIVFTSEGIQPFSRLSFWSYLKKFVYFPIR